MSHNTFGHLFRVTTWGESHGAAIGCVVDGCPPGIPLTAEEIQVFLDKRRPGQSRFTTQRREPDAVRILSGVFADDAGRQVTTGTPISLLIDNVDQRGQGLRRHQGQVPPRPCRLHLLGEIRHPRLPRRRALLGARDGHARGRRRGRAQGHPRRHASAARWCRSARTASTARAGTGTEVDNNPFFSPDPGIVEAWTKYLDEMRKAGSSAGAVIEVVAEGVPAGWGAPIYGKLDQDLAGAMMSINAVKGVEIGAGMAAAELTGEENADEIRIGNDGRPLFLSNNAGGILGGISTGQPIVVPLRREADLVDPRRPRRTIDRFGNETEIATKGRHDPCVGIRAVPVGEAMMAIVLADHFLRHRAQTAARLKAWPAGSSRSGSPGQLPTAIAADPAVPPFPDDKALVVFDGVCVLCSGFAKVHPEARHGLRLPARDRAIAARPGALSPLRPRHRDVRDQPRADRRPRLR